MSSRSPVAAASVAAPLPRRRRPLGRRLRRTAAPYGLLLPASAVIAAVLAYPLYYLVRLSFHHDWLANPWSGWGVIISLIVWGAIPFVAITLYAGLTQVSRELVEAASIDGASRWRIFRDITLPLLKPIYVIVISLSIIWDFQVFNQVWLITNTTPSPDYYVMAVYSYVTSFKISEYGLGSAIAVVMVAIMALISVFYVRQMVKLGDVE